MKQYRVVLVFLWFVPLVVFSATDPFTASPFIDSYSSSESNTSSQQSLYAINKKINKLRYAPDLENWGREEYWATPDEFFHKRAGDCEDYALAKYFALRQLGWPAKNLRLVHVITHRQQAHMVLQVFPAGQGPGLILDSLHNKLRTTWQATDLTPVYSFNEDSLWVVKTGWQEIYVSQASRIALWNQLVAKIQQQQ